MSMVVAQLYNSLINGWVLSSVDSTFDQLFLFEETFQHYKDSSKEELKFIILFFIILMYVGLNLIQITTFAMTG